MKCLLNATQQWYNSNISSIGIRSAEVHTTQAYTDLLWDIQSTLKKYFLMKMTKVKVFSYFLFYFCYVLVPVLWV